MKILHLPSIFEAGLRQAVLNCADVRNSLYANEIWSSNPWPLPREDAIRLFRPTVRWANLSWPMLQAAWNESDVDIVHHHGCWSLTSLSALLLKKRRHIPLVYSPHGAFVPASLARGRWAKSIYLHAWEKYVLKQVDCFTADSEPEGEAIAALGYGKPIALIPNGVNLADLALADRQKDFFAQWGVPANRFVVLFLSRIVPDKGLDILLDALAVAAVEHPDLHLVVAGDGPPTYKAELQKRAAEPDLFGRVSFIGAPSESEKLPAYHNADLFVLPSRNEGQGIVVLEALSQQTPVIASCHVPCRDLLESGCGWWGFDDSASLARQLVVARNAPEDQRRFMGERGRALIGEKYSNEIFWAAFDDLYRWLLQGKSGRRPACVKW